MLVFKTVVAAIVLCCLRALAAAEVPDQGVHCGSDNWFPLSSISSPWGQTFQPAQPTLTAVDLLLIGINGDPPSGDVTVNVREGGTPDGDIIGTSTVSYVIPLDAEEWVRFDFAPPLTVVPDASYMLEVIPLTSAFGIPIGDCGYDRGEAILGGSTDPFYDFSFRTFGLCGNGTIDAGEDCDDGVLGPDACCAAHTCLYNTNGAPCENDANACTLEVCSGTSAVCEAAAGNSPAGTSCDEDDDSLCTQGECDGAGQCVGVGSPVLTCNTAEKATLSLTQSATPGKDKVKFKWKNGEVNPLLLVLDPEVPTFQNIELCVYHSGTSLVHSSQLPSGTAWEVTFKEPVGTITYADKEGSVAGITKAGFKINVDETEKSQLSWQAGGENLTELMMSGSLGEPVIAQVVTGSGGCWGADFASEGIKKNNGAQFKGTQK